MTTVDTAELRRLADTKGVQTTDDGEVYAVVPSWGEVAVLLDRLETYRDALTEIGSAKVLADGDFGRELRARQDIARAALDTEQTPPKKQYVEEPVTPNSDFGI